MSSILEHPELNKLFLLYGNLDDMFFTPDLQKNNFRPYLNAYLRSLGYERIVFYSGAKNVGKYVLDDRSAVLAISKNKSRAGASASPDGSRPRQRRILNPRLSSQPETPAASPAAPSDTPAPQPSLIYKQPKITPAEFLDDAKKMMSDASVKTAIVFPFLQDFVTDGTAPLQQYGELISHLWGEYTLLRNDNICIFLAPQMTADTLSRLFDTLAGGNVFRGRFFNRDGTVNRSCTLQIGLPQQDEFGWMLDYLRLVGDGGRRITFRRDERPRLVSSLMYLSREADSERNRAGYLSAVYESVTRWLARQEGDIVPFDETAVKAIYARFKPQDNDDPMETLSHTRGWEAVARRVSEIVADYRRKKERAQSAQQGQAPSKPSVRCVSQRLDIPDDGASFDYPVPHFVIRGNPGVGKTTVARLIGRIFYEAGLLKRGLTVEATREDLVDRYVGGTAARTRDRIVEAQESVLFIDDAYSLLDSSEQNNYPKEAIDELVAAMTNPKQYRFCLIMAGYPEPMDELLKMNAGLSSRFSQANILTIDDYPPELLTDIFVNKCRREGYRFWGDAEGEEPPLDLEGFFENFYAQRDRANFGNARDVMSIAKEAMMQSSLRDDDVRCIMREDFGGYGKYFEKHGVSSLDEIYARLDQYVGLDFVKELFDNVRLEILDAQDCAKRGVKPDVTPDHYIFAGNPGTGKTTVGRMMGEFYHLMGVLGGAETLFTDASELIGSHVGDSKNNTVRVMQNAIDHNALLYIDEAYQIADTAYSSEIVGAMMTRMTENAADFKMIFGMYENRVEDFLKLNAGLSRRVRIVHFPDYTPAQLTAIFDRAVQSQGRTVTDETHRMISLLMEYKYNTRTESFGNAGEVRQLVADMKKRLLRRVADAPADVDRYAYTPDDIPPEQLALIEDQLHPRSFEDVMRDLNEQIGLSDLKEIVLRKQEEMLYARKTGRSAYDVTPGYYFFVGNPGTGKSTGAKLFAECLHELGVVKTDRFLSCTAKDLIGQYVGETDKKTYALLQKSVNGVLFIDEAYSLSYADEGSNAGFRREALEQIIAFMDDSEHRRTCCLIFAGYEKDMQGLYRSNSGMRSRIEEVHFRDFTAPELYRIFALFCRKAGYALSDGTEAYYTPIFEKMTRERYFSNGRTARTVFEKTAARLKSRVARAENLSPEQAETILPEDWLSEAECLAIVAG